MRPFDAEHAAKYDQTFAKLAPWAESLRLAAHCALAELPSEAHLLCVGAGTGAELAFFAEHFPGWRFTALDPSGAMLERCRVRMEEGGFAERCTYHEGYLDDLTTTETFDGATSLLVSQFVVDRTRRVDFFRQIRNRVRPGAPLVTADLCLGRAQGGRALVPLWQQAWRYAGIPEERIRALETGALDEMLSIVTSEAYAGLLTEAGWQEPVQVFQAVMMHGWATTA